MAKSRVNKWFIEGIKLSKRLNKKIWNRKLRRKKLEIYNHSTYKKLAGESMYDYML